MQEIWKDIHGYEGIYQVSNYGRFKSLRNEFSRKEKILKTQVNRKGYECISLHRSGTGKRFTVHRIVLSAFKENPEKKRTVNHIDGNKTNNYIDNLEWATHAENAIHSFRELGRVNAGPHSTLVINSETGIYYRSIKEAAISINRDYDYLGKRLSGKMKNNTHLRYA